MVAAMTGSKTLGINSPGVLEVIQYLKANPSALKGTTAVIDYLKSDLELFNKFNANLSEINENNFTNLNTTGDHISDVNSHYGTTIELPISGTGTSALIGLFSGFATSNPIVGITLLLGSRVILEEHSIDNVVNALNNLSSKNIDPEKIDNMVFNVQLSNGESKQILFISKTNLSAFENKYNIAISSDNIITSNNENFVLVDANTTIIIDGSEYNVKDLIKNNYQENFAIQNFITNKVESISKVISEFYDDQLTSKIKTKNIKTKNQLQQDLSLFMILNQEISPLNSVINPVMQ